MKKNHHDIYIEETSSHYIYIEESSSHYIDMEGTSSHCLNIEETSIHYINIFKHFVFVYLQDVQAVRKMCARCVQDVR